MSRGGPKITRDSSFENESGDRIDWLDSFAKSLESKDAPKSAVEAGRARSQQSLLDQISAIVGGGSPRYSTVDHAVQDMQERTGLGEYLRRVKASEQAENVKVADGNVLAFPKSFDKFDTTTKSNIDSFLKNRIKTHRGLVPLPALQEDLLTQFRRDGVQPQDVNNEDVARYISALMSSEQKLQPFNDMTNGNVGRGVGVVDEEDDGSNTDFFKGLMTSSQ